MGGVNKIPKKTEMVNKVGFLVLIRNGSSMHQSEVANSKQTQTVFFLRNKGK